MSPLVVLLAARLVLGGIAHSTGPSSGTPPWHTGLVWTATRDWDWRLQFAGCGWCYMCGGPFEQHYFQMVGSGIYYGSNHNRTPSSGCPHGSCSIKTQGPITPIERVVEAVALGEVDPVIQLLASYPDRVVFNAGRRVLQIYPPCAPGAVGSQVSLNLAQLVAARAAGNRRLGTGS